MKIYAFKLLIITASILVVSLPLLSCGSEFDNEGGIVLRIGSTRQFKTTNKFADYWYGVLASITTHDSLIKLDTEMNIVPWLATEWEISEDSRVFTFDIAEGARWHDGEPLTAEDVKFSIEYYRDKDPQAGWMAEVIDSVSTQGNRVTVRLGKPYGNLMMEFMTYAIIPRHIWYEVDEPLKYEGEGRAVGSGPFRLVSWDNAAGKFIFEANPEYFRGKPNIDRLEIYTYANMDALVMALVRGEIDTWWDYSGEFPITHIPVLEDAGGIEFAGATFRGVPAALGFNLEAGEPTSDPVLRQAVSLAVNYGQIAEIVYEGYGSVPGYGFVPPTHPNFDQAIAGMEHNPGKAAGLLDNSGITDSNGDGLREGADGKNLDLAMLVRNDMPGLMRVAEMVAADLEAVGIGTVLKAVDSSTWVAAKDAMEYDMVLFRATPWGTLMHAGHASGYFDSRRTGAGVLHNLAAPDYLALCDRRLETAPGGEQAELDRAIQQMHADYLPAIALVWLESVYPYREGWTNWVVDHIYGGVVNSFSWFEVTRVT